MEAITRLEAVWLAPGRQGWQGWLPARTLVGREAELLDSYLAQPRLTCCSFQCGFFIDVDGQPWSDDGAVDEPWMTLSWFHALAQLLGADRAEARAMPWEESQLTLRREAERVVLEDVHHTGQVSMRRVELPFLELAGRLCDEGEALAAVVRGLRAEAARRAPGSDAEREKLEAVLANLPGEGERELGLIARVRLGLAGATPSAGGR